MDGYADVANEVSSLLRDDKEILLISEAGIIPFVTKPRIIDYGGLATPRSEIAPEHQVWISSEAVYKMNPTLLLLSTQSNDGITFRGRLPHDEILLQDRHINNYLFVKRIEIPRNGNLLNMLYYHYFPAKHLYFEIYRSR